MPNPHTDSNAIFPTSLGATLRNIRKPEDHASPRQCCPRALTFDAGRLQGIPYQYKCWSPGETETGK